MRGRRHIVWAAVGASLVLAVASLAAPGGIRTYRRLASDVEALREETRRLEQENARLKDEARRLKDDPATIEQAAREELGLIGPHEIIFTDPER